MQATLATPEQAAQAERENALRLHEQAEAQAIAAEAEAAKAAAKAEAARKANNKRGDAKLRAIAAANKAEAEAKAKAEAARATEQAAAKRAGLKAESLAAHDAAGFTGNTYAGLSKPRNAGNTKAPNLHTSKATPRTFAQLTERMQRTLAELATGYGNKPFPLPGIDRGQAAIFLASGFFLPAGEAKATLSADTLKRFGPGAAKAPKA